MRADGALRPCQASKRPLSPAAREAIDRVRRVLENGCSAQEQAQAAAELAVLPTARQATLPLRHR